MRTLNLGILAHVDAGKTSLTERLLHAAGVIDEVGSVDDGNTQTDTLALERRRGITIKSAVVSFTVGGADGVTVNLIDTPGHPDFIAEVERALGVLDGAVLVVSAVEGVQAQTRVLMRTLRRLRIPAIIFVNKIDRSGADPGRVLRAVAERLTPDAVPLGAVRAPGTRAAAFVPYGPRDAAFLSGLAETLAERDDALLAAYVAGGPALSHGRLRRALADQTARARAYPVLFGSAITGAGTDALLAGIEELLPAAEGDAGAPASGTVFKVERGPAGERVAYVRARSGTFRVRERVRFGPPEQPEGREGRITAIRVFDRGGAGPRAALTAGRIGTVLGLPEARIGDEIREAGRPGPASGARGGGWFAPPSLETVVVPRRPAERGALRAALAELAEQDPLIALRQDDERQEISVSLYGEVQKEVLQATLAADHGLEVTFRETTTICVERPAAAGEAVELLGQDGNPFVATVGLRVEPAPPGSGVAFRVDAPLGSLPLYVYKSAGELAEAIGGTVRETLRQGLRGWEVVDCAVTLTRSGYVSPASTARDFRLLTPLVLMSALRRAGTVVCEPVHRFHLEVPADTVAQAVAVLGRLRAVHGGTAWRGAWCELEGDIPAAEIHRLERQVPALTRGEGVLETSFDRYRPVRGPAPVRRRHGRDPLDREQYLLHVARRV
ncbi:elongation factor G [Nonomuraea rhodomycinica]|uniref:TetM/TetW/TetO/TetS family tetracycline resistance ribosomal protection protein n=1 Tax=Nonomuraea rhodomycinica TaxID=1712872 RepID=A0A7Y6MBK6_9ACTN|nr:TetM/TetW/TetO/TetS family tetracycline resistance ribosomal protection protein [Nonomuraea rhodomycinica]NUW41792.1 TetM/TetW/TetO/TetS family tetracycline resistance ribosomal protection protein [Nonomuraea rhodomycinica]